MRGPRLVARALIPPWLPGSCRLSEAAPIRSQTPRPRPSSSARTFKLGKKKRSYNQVLPPLLSPSAVRPDLRRSDGLPDPVAASGSIE